MKKLCLLAFLAAPFLCAEEPPTIPAGLDAFRQWDRWAYQRIGARTYMRSTYDRNGGNEGADASHFLYQLSESLNVALDVQGPGILYFARYNHWHGSPWHYLVDGSDHIVQESNSADPDKRAEDSVFLPAELFPTPLTWTWSITKGADLMWVPIPFEKSFQMAYGRTHYGTGYFIYQQFVRGSRLSQPIKAWDGKSPPDQDVLNLIARAGTDLLAPTGAGGIRKPGLVKQEGGPVALGKNAALTVLNIKPKQPVMLRALEFTVPRAQAVEFGKARLRVTWDGMPNASIDAPVALFFGAGTLYNSDDREYLVKAFPIYIRQDADSVHLACFFPMPFFRSAHIELVGNGHTDLKDIRWSVRHLPFKDPMNHVGYFHATYRDHPKPERGKDLSLLDTRQTEGGGDWSGSFVGTSFIFSDRAVLNTLEGDPRFFFDDSQTPQAYGTGTEEWGGGGDYWGGQNMSLPFAGHPVGARNSKSAKNDEDKIESAYRFLLSDLMPFGKNAVIRMEHGATNESLEHYQTVAYWYGLPGASLVKTDELKIGDSASEVAHAYSSPEASAPYEITSRYEWGPDTIDGKPDGPRAQPDDFVEFEFEAVADKRYAIWVRGRKPGGVGSSGAFWMQFDEDINTPKMAASYAVVNGFGTQPEGFPAGTCSWSGALPEDLPRTVTFTNGGKHRLRIQPRSSGYQLEQIWLSSTQKNMPEPALRAPASSSEEIAINAANPLLVKGQTKVINDSSVPAGRVLEINGEQTQATESLEAFPPHTDQGRRTAGASEFFLKLEPENLGVMLRRKLDYELPNQRAEVFIADKNDEAPVWKLAGTWYLAGSNTCVYSNPKAELGATVHSVQTSNRRFRDDEFLVPRDLTEGRTAIRVRVKFTPVTTPLFPGRPLPELGWSEIRYDAYCFVMPKEPGFQK